MRAVIYGITGQDGSFLAELLLAKGYHVLGVSRRTSTPNDSRIKHLYQNPNFRVVIGDVTDAFSVYRIIQDNDPDEVFNLSAQSHVGVSFDQPAYTWDATAKGCLNILEAIRDSSDPLKIRFYQASSSEMFGSAYSMRPPTKSEDGPVSYQDELTPMLPNSPYAVAKLAAHNMVRVYRDAYGLFACSGILFNHESERRSEGFVTRKITKHVANIAQVFMSNGPEPPKVEPLRLGNLDACRDWGHAEDYVEAMWLMLQQPSPDDFVISTGETHTVKEFLTEAFTYLSIDLADRDTFSRHVSIDSRLFRPSEVPYLRGDSRKAKCVLGWSPRVDFKGLVRRMVLSDMRQAGVYSHAALATA